MHICVASSPIHLICFKEYLNKFKINEYKIYILSSTNTNVNIQLKKTLSFLSLKNIKFIIRNNSKFIQFLQKYKFLYYMYNLYKNRNCIFIISDFRNTILHQLRILFKNSKFILIDDGAQICKYYDEFIKNDIFFPWKEFNNFFSKIKFLINYGFNLNFLINSNIDLFTIYGKELGLKKDFQNNLDYLKKNFSIKSSYCKSSVYFIGSKMAEENRLTYEEEINSLKKVRDYWHKKNKNLFYVAKRTTSQKKINIIKSELGLKVITNNLPIEIQFLEKNIYKIPNIICSFGSSVDKTFPMIYEKSSCYLMIINDLRKYKFFDHYFDLFKDIMIKSKLKKNIVEL